MEPIRSWSSPKTRKGGDSIIAGRGVHAIEPIARGEVVAVKGGHLVDGATVAALPESVRSSGFQIAEDRYLAALHADEYEDVMMLVNHSCRPNVGMGGNVLLVSMEEIAVGEELSIDYALFLGDPDFSMACHCGAGDCRGVVTGTDWTRREVQDRHRGWFSWWLQQKIDGWAPG